MRLLVGIVFVSFRNANVLERVDSVLCQSGLHTVKKMNKITEQKAIKLN